MTDGDDESAAEPDGTAESDEQTDVTPDSLDDRLDGIEADLDAAETEADLDDVAAVLDAIEADLDGADLPVPDDDDEEDPAEALESRISGLRDELEAERGPYAADVIDAVGAARSTLTDTRWTERGRREVADAVAAFADVVDRTLGTALGDADGDAPADAEALAERLDDVVDAVEDAALDPDDDAGTIADLLEATDDLESGLEDAQEWDDLETNEQLMAEGFYDVLGHYKDFPPELSALKEWEKRGRVDMVLLAKDSLQSQFMQNHCMDALVRMANPDAFEEMHGLAQRRNKKAITALGRMGSGADDAVETLIEYVDADSDPGLQKVTFRALGEIGSPDATQALANKLEMDNDNVRPYAARALGLIGDTRAIDPLSETLDADDVDAVRAAAAWALRQIGTEAALEAAAEYTDERSYLVQHEADRAADALDDGDGDADADAEAPTV